MKMRWEHISSNNFQRNTNEPYLTQSVVDSGCHSVMPLDYNVNSDNFAKKRNFEIMLFCFHGHIFLQPYIFHAVVFQLCFCVFFARKHGASVHPKQIEPSFFPVIHHTLGF